MALYGDSLQFRHTFIEKPLHSETPHCSPQNTAVPKLKNAIRGAEIPTSSHTRTFLKWVKVRVSSELGGFRMEGFPQ